jgi:hypothetical protein
MERKLVRNKTEFIQLCKHWREVEGYYTCMREDDIAHPSEYPCVVMIEEQLSKDGSDWCNFHYVYKSDFDVVDDEETDDTVRLEDDFFNCDINDYKAIIGKCFRHDNVVLKVLGIRDDFDNKYYEKGHYETEFLYEQYECYNDKWHIQEYIWLQESVYCEYASESYQKEYLRFCLTPNTEMNIGREGMYMLGKDGLLYTDDDGSGENYNRYEEIPNELFEKIRTEAIENDGVYKVVGTYIDR